ncbi:DUF2141 domain-containing protein [Spirosoma radiotolerans]|uniref:DUF2141 domain-containing protein n=1 Tax=Spirosoma radiotolerans TaxID=1379870 RepID=UPI000696AF8F|nr:DUF2141 domain-containing protein [Spirosoma radiotolerans]
MKTILTWVVLQALWTTSMFAQGALTVNVTGFETDKGHCKIWLFNSADGFPSDDKKALRCVEVPIEELTSLFVFDRLPAGNYALGVVHDENGNHRLDYNLFRIPREAYGISNDARGGVSGPPTFEQAILRVPPTGLTVTVNVR